MAKSVCPVASPGGIFTRTITFWRASTRWSRSRTDSTAEGSQGSQAADGISGKAVSGYIPAFVFFDCLRNRNFRRRSRSGGRSARLSARTGHFPRCLRPCPDAHGRRSRRRWSGSENARIRRSKSRRESATKRNDFDADQYREGHGSFLLVHDWFGLIDHRRRRLRVYGSGLLSSFGEIEHAIDSTRCGDIRYSRNGRSIRASR